MSNLRNATSQRAFDIASKVEAFVRDVVIPYERDVRRDAHGPMDALVDELRERRGKPG